jgi:uroporphyrinogen-III synthase
VRAQLRAAGLADWWQRCRFVLTHPSLGARVPAPAGGAGQQAMVKICMPNDESIFQAFVAA